MTHAPALIEAARGGDERALLQLLEVSRPHLKHIAATQCASAADADDAVQESLWHVYRRIGALRTIGSYAAWLFSIVRRECQRLMRQMRGRVDLPADDDPLFACVTTPDLRVDLAAALQSLPERYREAIVLRDFEECSIAEMAAALRLTRAAVKSRIHRGREMMREYLEA
ncbi:MAG: RNA polymerase sigma factor [Burkholderiaceae bacterium]|jgi:RNA polymerase sigma factor (sigma-70 family)|nr:MAG: RNA polymerase sigma factor [Burkholderiaceae bacterium]